jgi:hypothetical protein
MIGSIVGVDVLVGVGWIVGWREHPGRASARIIIKIPTRYFFMSSSWTVLSL